MRMRGECAVVHLKMTTLRNTDGAVIRRHFWNTRMFVQQGGEWKCAVWQVTEIKPPAVTTAPK